MLALAGCRVPEPAVPLRGPQPDVIAVWPQVPAALAAERALLVTGLDVALRARGYRVMAQAVSDQMLTDAGLLGEDADRERVGRALGADALLQLEVREFAAAGTRPLRAARWDLRWRLVDGKTGAELWSFEHHGTATGNAYDTGDPLRAFDAEPEIVPIGGRGPQGFRDAIDLVSWLHRHAFAHLQSPR